MYTHTYYLPPTIPSRSRPHPHVCIHPSHRTAHARHSLPQPTDKCTRTGMTASHHTYLRSRSERAGGLTGGTATRMQTAVLASFPGDRGTPIGVVHTYIHTHRSVLGGGVFGFANARFGTGREVDCGRSYVHMCGGGREGGDVCVCMYVCMCVCVYVRS